MSDQPRLFLGCVADDVTGATDLAINLVKGGMRVVQFLTVPTGASLKSLDCDAVVVGLKTRSVPAEVAVTQSLAAVEALQAAGCRRFYFKYCSTFDSTDRGNIGPVAAAMIEALHENRAVVCPSFPAAGRTVYLGHLFVNGQLLHESGMQNHPLNPMTDANIVRFLGRQTELSVGLIAAPQIAEGALATAAEIDRQTSMGNQLLVTDTCRDADLATVAEAIVDHTLVTGGSGIARYLPAAWRNKGLIGETIHCPALKPNDGKSLIVVGSCSEMTQSQVAFMIDRCESYQVDVEALMENFDAEVAKFETVVAQVSDRPLMIYSTAAVEEVQPLHDNYGREKVCRTVEQFHGRIAKRLVDGFGFKKIIVAGGETSGAVIKALEIKRLEIGPEICTGVPWTFAMDQPGVALALKSGNFGGEDFFETALAMFQKDV